MAFQQNYSPIMDLSSWVLELCIQEMCNWVGLHSHHLESKIHTTNWQAEKGVQTVKNLPKNAAGGDIYASFMNYRSPPIDGIGLSPSQQIMNRQLRTKLHLTCGIQKLFNLLKPHQPIVRQKKQKHHYDRHFAMLPTINKDVLIRVQKEAIHSRSETSLQIVRSAHGWWPAISQTQLFKSRETTLLCIAGHSEPMYDTPPQHHSAPDLPNATSAKPNQYETATTPHRERRPQRTPRRPKHLEGFIPNKLLTGWYIHVLYTNIYLVQF